MSAAALRSLVLRLEQATVEVSSEPDRAAFEVEAIVSEARDLAKIAEALNTPDPDGIETRAWSLVGAGSYLLARVAVEADQHDRAFLLLDVAERAHLRAGDSESAVRTTLGRMHVLDNQGRHREAISVGTESLAGLGEAEESESEELMRLRGALHENLGVALALQGDHRRAMAQYATAGRFFDRLPAAEDRLRIRANLGVELLEVGRFAEAVAQLAGVAESFSASGDLWWYGVAGAYLARAHLGLGATERAVDVAERAAGVLSTIGASVEANRAHLVVASSMVATGRHDDAWRLALDVLRDASRAQRAHERGQAWFIIGLVLADRGRLRSARRAFSKSASIHIGSGEVRAAARARVARAELADDIVEVEIDLSWVEQSLRVEDGPLELARVAFVRSQWLEGSDFIECVESGLTLCGSESAAQLYSALEAQRGRHFRFDGDLDRAEECFLRAAARDTRRTRLMPIDRQWRVNGTGSVDAADELVSLLIERGRQEDLDEALRRVETLKARALVRSALSRGATTARHSSSPTEIAADRSISWCAVGGKVVGFASTSGSVKGTVVVERAQVEASVARLNAAVEASINASAGPASGTALLRELDLLGETLGVVDLLTALVVEDVLPSVVSVSCDDVLRSIPIGSLGGFRGRVDAIERPTLAWRSSPIVATRSTLVVDCGGADLSERETEIAAIVAEAHEVTVARNVGSLDQLSELVAQHDVVHLIGHASTQLRGTPAAVRFETWSLSPEDLSALDLAGRVVVLNVCGSQSSRLSAGSDPHGLAAGALAAGADSVIGCHWPVVDGVAVIAARTIHRALAAGQTTTAAVTETRSAIAFHHEHPIFWAGWTLQSFAAASVSQELST